MNVQGTGQICGHVSMNNSLDIFKRVEGKKRLSYPIKTEKYKTRRGRAEYMGHLLLMSDKRNLD